MAEFIDVMKQKARMCNSKRCGECELSYHNNGSGLNCHIMTEENPEKAEEIIMKWVEEHPDPAKTNAEKLKEVFGVDILKNTQNCIGIRCPEEMRFKKTCDDCEYKGFWGKEYEDDRKN